MTMKRAALLAVALLATSSLRADDLPRSTPEKQGVSSREVLEFVEAADKQIESMNSFMLLRHGHVVAEGWWAPYEAKAPHSLYSLSKSFTSTAIGIAISEGKLHLDDEVLKFFPEDAPANPSDNLKAMRISDLLRMSTGQQTEPPRPADVSWTKSFLVHPVPFKPGTHFLYNTSATYMLSAIIQKVTGTTLLEYLKPRLFDPLGIEHPTWETSPQGISTGGYGLSIRTEDIARFGQLYLQKGKWHDKQLVPAAWVEAATSLQTSNGSRSSSDWDQGYGYQFWRSRHGAYRGDGAFGQYCVVMPEQDAVLVITSGVRDMQSVLNLVWDKLLPALKSSPLSPETEAADELTKKLQALSLPTENGDSEPSKANTRVFRFPSNDRKLESVQIEPGKDDTSTVILKAAGQERRIELKRAAWQRGRLAWGPLPEGPVASTGAWTDKDTFTGKVCFYETPFIMHLRLKFSGDEVEFDSGSNVGFGPTKMPVLKGKAGD